MKTLQTLIAALALLGASAIAETKPNVVLIYSDDHGWGDVGYHGYDDVMTPNIDKLAAQGTQFSQGYVSASVCGPSRAGLLTGVYQQRMGAYGNYDKGGIPTSQPTIFEMLKREGYTCAAVGKWHVGMAREELRPNSRGVDFFYGFLGGAHDYYNSTIDQGNPRASLRPIFRNTEIQPPIQESKGYLTDMFTKEAVQFIEQADEEPFFLYLAYNSVHAPWQVPDSYLKRVQHLDTHDERKLFAAMVLAMDDGVGAVMKALEAKGVADDTLVIFLGDNGTPRGQGIAQPKRKTRGTTTMSSPGPFNGFKGDTYEGGIRVPFVIQWPGRVPAGKTYANPVVNLDIVATIMARCGVSRPWKGLGLDGVDLLPYIAGEKSPREGPHETLYWRRDDDYAIRKGDWKLEWNDESGPRTIRLFNLVDDPGEWNDLSGGYPERAQTLQDLFDDWDSQLPENQSGRKPKNRNYDYASGKRVNVAAFNARIVGEARANSAERPSASPRPRGEETRTLEQQLAHAKANAKKRGKAIDVESVTRFFHAKDLNHDGILDAKELKTKAPVGWNDH